MLSTILLIILILILLGALPTWPYSRGWGYFPSGLVGVVLVILLILLLVVLAAAIYFLSSQAREVPTGPMEVDVTNAVGR